MISTKWRRVSQRMRALSVMMAVLATALAGFAAPLTRAQEAPAPKVTLEKVADGFNRPVQVIDPDDGSGRLFVVEQVGTVRILKDGATLGKPLLDISGNVSGGNEQGLLSIALHPSFTKNGTFFIDYTDTNGNTQVERWQISADDPNVADPSSRQTVLEVDQPYPNHNGGLLLFGPDGDLYIGLGDGGSQGDPSGTGQRPDDLLGSILRIDVDDTTGNLPYAIPKDNPFADGKDGRAEVYAYGLRNPWRFSFDRKTGELFIGDVGQNTYEEIDRLDPKANDRNFGWNILEGFTCYQTENCDQTGLTPPIFAYSHDVGGCSVTGGYVYRGKQLAELQGTYLFADYCTGLLWGLTPGDDGTWQATTPLETGLSISSFGEDADGELFVVDLGGGIYRMTAGS